LTIFISDISHHDNDRGPINFASVRGAGIDIVIAKATEADPAGYHFMDPKFVGNVTNARRAGIKLVGGYHCLSAGTDSGVKRQVDFFLQALNQVGGYAKGWAMIDVEPFPELKSRGLSPKFDDIEAFEAHWADATKGWPLGLYLPKWYWEEMGSPTLTKLKGFLVSSNYPISARQPFKTLYAHDGGDAGPGWHSYGGKTPSVWQYASSDAVPGITGNCDMNAFKGTEAQFITLATHLVAPTPPPAPKPIPAPSHPAWKRVLVNHSPKALMHGDDVKEWQAQMKKRGWKIGVDGYYGNESMNVCLAFQREKKLHVPHGGQVDKLTWDTSWTAPITK